MHKYHPGALLLHVERAAGSRQDLCTEGSLAVYMNYPFYVEFLDEMLRKANSGHTADKDGSILQRNLLVALTSREMIALARFLSIMHISVCMPFRWLAGSTHMLAIYDWGPMSMGRALDTLQAKLNCIYDSPTLILNKDFMMGLFQEYQDELPPFDKYLTETFTSRKTKVIARKSGTKVIHYARL